MFSTWTETSGLYMNQFDAICHRELLLGTVLVGNIFSTSSQLKLICPGSTVLSVVSEEVVHKI